MLNITLTVANENKTVQDRVLLIYFNTLLLTHLKERHISVPGLLISII